MPLSGWLAKHRSPTEAWPHLRDRLVIGTFRGRSAVALACRLLGIGAGHEILVPAYNCGTELDALLYSGARVVGYRVSRKCQIDLEDLMARRTSRTRAVYLIHYFGWEQPMEQLRRWCNEHGLFLIEDCALALFSAGIGRTGDAAIFSLPKTLGMGHGGLLSLPKSSPVEIPSLRPAGSRALFEEIWQATKATTFRGLESLGLYGTLHSARRRSRPRQQDASGEFPPMPGNYYFMPDVDADRAIHPQAWSMAGSLSSEEIVRRRRHNYRRMAEALGGNSGVLHHEISEGVCPLSFPLRVSNRDACVAALQDRGVPALPWWAGFHQGGIDWSQFPEARELKQQMLTLPIHQNLDDEHLTYVAKTATQILG